MKLNNKGFAISTIMYMILIMAVVLIALTLTLVSSRKLILDKARKETLNIIYNSNPMTYRQVLNVLKTEILNYAANNNVVSETIPVSEFDTSIDESILDTYDLSSKIIQIEYEDSEYHIYINDYEL